MPETNESHTQLALARLEGMLNAVLPQHTARLDEHDRALTNIAAIVTQQGQDIAAVKAVATERAVVKRTVPTWVSVAGLLVSAAAVAVTILFFALSK